MATTTSSPRYVVHNRNQVQNFVVLSSNDGQEIVTVDQVWEELYGNPNGLGCVVHKYSGLLLGRCISFQDTSTTPPLDHPTGTECGPDFAARPSTKDWIHWTEIDGQNSRVRSREKEDHGQYRNKGRGFTDSISPTPVTISGSKQTETSSSTEVKEYHSRITEAYLMGSFHGDFLTSMPRDSFPSTYMANQVSPRDPRHQQCRRC